MDASQKSQYLEAFKITILYQTQRIFMLVITNPKFQQYFVAGYGKFSFCLPPQIREFK